jgi:hypothetical protein
MKNPFKRQSKEKDTMDPKWVQMKELAQADLLHLIDSQRAYGDSWKRRGGIGAFMMLARKFDRIEQQSKAESWDIFKAAQTFNGDAGLIDDIRDLRRYLLLVDQFLTYNEEPEEWDGLEDSSDETDSPSNSPGPSPSTT